MFPGHVADLLHYLLVRHSVVVEVRAGGEALATHGTLVWLLTGVNSTMSVERTGSGERLETYVACVRLLTFTRQTQLTFI